VSRVPVDGPAAGAGPTDPGSGARSPAAAPRRHAGAAGLDAFLAGARAALGEPGVHTDEATRASWASDWTRVPGNPAAVVLPATVGEIAAVVRLAAEHRVPLVPAGGLTGLSAGAVANGGEVVLALLRMQKVLGFDPVGRLLRVEAGATTAAVQTAAAERGLFFPLDLASAASATLGGNVATHAGGLRVVRYGPLRDWIAGLVVVTGRGDVLELGRGLVKDQSGLDLLRLMIGSEGTLGIVAEVTVRLAPAPRPRATALLALPRLADLDAVFLAVRDRFTLEAFELVSALGLAAVAEATGEALPFADPVPASPAGNAPGRGAFQPAAPPPSLTAPPGVPAYALLVEVEAADETTWERFLGLLGELLDRGLIGDAVPTRDPHDARRLWTLRERISESLAPRGPCKYDVAVPLARVANFLAALERLLAGSFPGVAAAWYGHVGDGNLHLNVLPPSEPRERLLHLERLADLDQAVWDLVGRFGGSTAAEHGVGLLKRAAIDRCRTPAELAAMRAIKAAFDPADILNPGKAYDQERA
jgi:FAD/FMN-containing dehydrogenase